MSMKVFCYSRWDGSQTTFSLDAGDALRAAADLMMQGLTLEQALGWMRQHGFLLNGMQVRVMGTEELGRELRRELERLRNHYRLDEALDEVRERLESILDREQAAIEAQHGIESAALNEFLVKRHTDDTGVSDTIERFRDHEFSDGDAEDDFQALLEELDRLKALERFVDAQGASFTGSVAAGYEAAQSIRSAVEALEQLTLQLSQGDIQSIDPAALRDLIGDAGAQSVQVLLALEQTLRDDGYLDDRDGSLRLTPQAVRKIGAQALADMYSALQKDHSGEHRLQSRGAALPRPDGTRPYRFGDALELDVVRSMLNAVRRTAASTRGALSVPIRVHLEDLEVRELDDATDTTTVLLLDLSWSMSFAGRFAAAKRVALAMEHMIRTAFPRDRFFIVGFSTRARQLSYRELPEVTWDAGDPFTNLQAGLMVAEDLILRNPCPSPQIIVITDGQPTAYYAQNQLHAEWPMGPGGISPHAVAETMKQVHRVTRRGITINTFMLDDAPELVAFVERMTEINRGRAFFTAPEQLGSFLTVDYVSRRRQRR